MHAPKKKPEPARVSGSISDKSIPGNCAPLAAIRHRDGRGFHEYERAKSEWHKANPGAEPRQIELAMRLIAKAVGV